MNGKEKNNGNGNEPKVIVIIDNLGMQRRGTLKIKSGELLLDVKEIITHPKPDLDAIAPYIIGTYCGILMPKLTFEATNENGLIRGKTAIELLREGIIVVDTGGRGPFDHHPATEFPGECAASRFYDSVIPAEMKNEKLDKFVRFVIERDTRPTARPVDFSAICKALTAYNADKDVCSYMKEMFYAYMSTEDKPNTELFLKIFEEFARGKTKIPPVLAKYVENIRAGKFSNIPDLLSATTEGTSQIIRNIMEEIYQNQLDFDQAKITLKNSPDRRLWSNNSRELVCITTENKQTLRAALEDGFSIIVIRNKSGNTGIYTQIRHIEINTNDIYNALIAAEIIARSDPKIVRKIWYNHASARQILNGSFTTPNTTSTALTIGEIADIIVNVCKINNGYLPYCKGGDLQCSDKCKFHWMNVSTCQGIRKEQEAIDQMFQDGDKIVISNEFGGGLRRRPESKIKQVK